jgi:hypothetical protein
MRRTIPRSPAMTTICVGGLLLLGARCGNSNTEGNAGSGGSGTGGPAGNGGAVGTGGTVGTGGAIVATGGNTVGGRASGGAGASSPGGRIGRGTGGAILGGGGVSGGSGTGGQAALGGASSQGDAAAVETGGNERGGAEVKRDTAVDAPAPSTDSNPTSGPDSGCVPDYACKPVAPNTGDPYADCVARVNQFRACVCLPPLARWADGETCANQDAKYDSEQGTAHAGAQADICDWGNAQDECPDWKRATAASVVDGCLQMMFEEGPPPTSTCTGQCYEDHGHYINMTGTKYKYGVACGFYTTASGSVWATQNFK